VAKLPRRVYSHFVGKDVQLERDVEVERVGGLEIDDEPNLVGCITGRSPGFSPSGSTGIDAQQPIVIRKVGAVVISLPPQRLPIGMIAGMRWRAASATSLRSD
jgi:hypothetical protein